MNCPVIEEEAPNLIVNAQEVIEEEAPSLIVNAQEMCYWSKALPIHKERGWAGFSIRQMLSRQ